MAVRPIQTLCSRALAILLLAGGGCASDPAAQGASSDAGHHASGEDADPGAHGDPSQIGDAGHDANDAGSKLSNDGGQESSGLRLPPSNAGLDYQLGQAYAPKTSVGIVSRDRNADPAPGIYNICYVNGFQAQPDEADFWLNDHPDLVLRDSSGDPIVDPDWDEMLLDVSSAEKRKQLSTIVGGWIMQCARDGFDAVEIDNLDTYARSSGRIAEDDAVAFIRMLADRAHAEGLAIAQKNSAEIVGRRAEMKTDFVVAEECNRYSECDVYTQAYGEHVLIIEYRRQDFTKGCAAYPNLSIVLRDLDLVGPSSGNYVYDGC